MNDSAGFTLIEMVCTLALVGLLAAIALPAFSTSTTRTALSSYAVEIAAVLKRDRVAAVRNHELVATRFDTQARSIISGVDGARVTLPGDVAFDALLAQRCGDRRTGSTIDFLSSGESCGGAVAISRQGFGFQIRVNWLTGGVEIVPVGKS
jgi:general secretion pathway protein H